MLSDIRNNVNHPFIKVLLGTIIIVFVFFFGWSMRTPKSEGSYVAKVNGDQITAEEYRIAYSNLLELYGRITGQRLNAEQATKLGLDKRAMDQLVDQKLLMQEADRRGYKVSDEDLAAAIQRQNVFFDGGVFNREKYAQVLAANSMTPASYEALKRQELLIGKVEEAAKGNAVITEEEIVSEFKDRRSTVAADYAAFDPADYIKQVLVTTERLKEFYAAEGEKFRAEEKRSARYVFFPAESYMSQIPVSDDDAKKEYERNPGKYTQPGSVRARHILVRATNDPAKDEARILKLRSEIAGGKDFAAVAKASSEDEGTRASGGDLGFFNRNSMVPEFENAAFALNVGELSKPVRTQFGYHLIKVEAKTPDKKLPFEEVKGAVLSYLKHDKAVDLAYKDADNTLMDLEQKKTDWNALGKRFPVKTTTLLAAKERDGTVPQTKGFMETLFEMPESKSGQIMEASGGAYIIAIAEKRPAQIPPMDLIRSEVEAKYRVVESRKLAKAAAARFATEAGTRGWASAAKAQSMKTGTTETFSKKSGSIPPLGPSADAVKAIFDKPETGRIVATPFEFDDKVYIFRISAATAPNMASLEGEREKIKADILPAKQSLAVEELLKSLRASAKTEGLDQFQTKQ